MRCFLTATIPVPNAGVLKNFGSETYNSNIFCSRTTILVISNAGMQDIMKIIKYLKDSDTLLKGVHETNKMCLFIILKIMK